MLFNVRCVLFHFFYAILKFCVVFVVGIIQRAIPVNYGRTSTEITKLHTTPTNLTVRVTEHFHPIRMTCSIQPEPYFLATLKIEESPPISLSFRNPQRERTSIRLFPNSSSLINHYEESHLVYGSLGSILLDQGILVKKKKQQKNKKIRWYTLTTSYLLSLLRGS